MGEFADAFPCIFFKSAAGKMKLHFNINGVCRPKPYKNVNAFINRFRGKTSRVMNSDRSGLLFRYSVLPGQSWPAIGLAISEALTVKD
jgi:hypothetical protein